MLIDRRILAHFDWGLFLVALSIPLFGLLVLYSAGYDPEKISFTFDYLRIVVQSHAFVKQSMFLGLGLIMMLIGMMISSDRLLKLSYLIYILLILSLLAVLMFGIVSNGSRRWLQLGGLNFQPSEPMKLGMILALARYLSRNPPRAGELYGFRQLIPPFLIFGLPMLLIMRQPDLGTALCVGAVGFLMVAFVGIRPKALIIMVTAILGALFPAWHLLHPYQQRRILTLINPDADPLGSGYHIIQSKIAVGSGGFWGKGFLQGTQSQLEFLPEHTTDFIFSVLAEEWGFVGSFVVVLLFMGLVYRILRVVLKSKDLYASLVSLGIASLVFFHATVNIGMVLGILPVVGIPLPLFSYGGSSMLSFMFSIGIVLGISMRRLVFLGFTR